MDTENSIDRIETITLSPEKAKSGIRKSVQGWAGKFISLYGLLMVAHILYVLFRSEQDEYVSLVSNLATIVMYVGPFVLAWRTSMHQDLAPRTRRGWRLTSLAYLTFVAGSILWLYFENIQGTQPFPSFADVGFLMYYPLMLLGLLSLAAKLTTAEERIKFALDSCIVMVAAGMFLWYFLLQPIEHANSGDQLTLALSLAYPIGDLVLLFGIISVILRQTSIVSPWPARFLVGGLILNFAGDFAFIFETLNGVYQTASWVDTLFTMSCFPVMLGAHCQFLNASSEQDPEASPARKDKMLVVWLPYCAIALAYAMIMNVVLQQENPVVLNQLVVMAAVLTALVVVRQIIAMRENAKAKIAIEQLQERVQNIIANVPGVVWETKAATDDAQSLNYVSVYIKTMLGYSVGEWLARPQFWLEIIHPEDRERTEREALAMYAAGTGGTLEFRWISRSGDEIWVESRNMIILNDEGRAVGIRGVTIDISERKRAEKTMIEMTARKLAAEETIALNAELAKQGEQLNTIVGNVQGVVWETKTKIENGETFRRFDFISDYIETMLGYTAAECLANPDFWIELVHPDDRIITEQRVRAIFEGGKGGTIEFRWIARDGHVIWVESRNAIIRDDRGNAVGLRGIAVDITERKSLEEQLTHQALHDPLTKLANRVLFRDRVEHAISRSGRKPTPISVLFLDLDNFKTINDSLGHAAGDELLILATERLQACLRASDTPARLGGDEFAILIEDIDHPDEAAAIAERIRSVLCSPFSISGTEVFISASIGVATRATENETPDELIRNADVAMYRSKGAGKDRYTIFENEMHDVLIRRLRLESDMRSAIDAEQFELYYQPIMDLASDRIMGMEALVRWNHPEHGLIPPFDFIPVAEESGLIVPLGEWILNQACRQASQWQAECRSAANISITVNVAGRQFLEDDFLKIVTAALAGSGLPEHSLVLEITESSLLVQTEETIQKLHDLKRLGIRLAIDDFGTGYSSLSYLQQLPVDILKIDKSFVDKVLLGKEGAAVAKAIIAMGKTLQLKTIAEGIENRDQQTELRHLGCELGQGYHFARPLRAGDMMEFLHAQVTPDEFVRTRTVHTKRSPVTAVAVLPQR